MLFINMLLVELLSPVDMSEHIILHEVVVLGSKRSLLMDHVDRAVQVVEMVANRVLLRWAESLLRWTQSLPLWTHSTRTCPYGRLLR